VRCEGDGIRVFRKNLSCDGHQKQPRLSNSGFGNVKEAGWPADQTSIGGKGRAGETLFPLPLVEFEFEFYLVL
jgi:hypothetical protein